MAEHAIAAVLGALAGRRLPLEDEKATQAAIQMVLCGEFHVSRVKREVPIMGGRIDFLVDPAGDGEQIGIEVKIKGQPREILRQIRGYAWEPSLAGLVLATARTMWLPADICGKPLAVVGLGKAWL
jgi:hypothetical protein